MVSDDHPVDRAALEKRRDTASRGFDLWKLWHEYPG
jgi:hypothetical protein